MVSVSIVEVLSKMFRAKQLELAQADLGETLHMPTSHGLISLIRES